MIQSLELHPGLHIDARAIRRCILFHARTADFTGNDDESIFSALHVTFSRLQTSHEALHFAERWGQLYVTELLLCRARVIRDDPLAATQDHKVKIETLPTIDWAKFDAAAQALPYLKRVWVAVSGEREAREFVQWRREAGQLEYLVERDILWVAWPLLGPPSVDSVGVLYSDEARVTFRSMSFGEAERVLLTTAEPSNDV